MSGLPRLFIGSATESERIARRLGRALDGHIELHLWSEVFGLGELNLQALQREAAECDFAVFVWGVEDTTVARGRRSRSPRDNVVYEAGLFAGALGEDRVFVVHAEKTKIPSDYLGVTTATFDPASPNVDRIVERILGRVARVGRKPTARFSGHWWQLVMTSTPRSTVSFFEARPEGDGRRVNLGGHAWNEHGKLISRWDSVSTQFDARTETLHYAWEGTHHGEPGIPLYFGVGTIRYGKQPVIGEFSSTRRSPGRTEERTRFSSCFYLPARPGHVETMTGADPAAWKPLVDEMLALRAAFDVEAPAEPGTGAAQRGGLERLLLSDQMPPVSHYCHGVRAGNVIWVSGMVGCTADGHIPDDVVDQFRIALDAADAVVRAAGGSARSWTKVRIFLTDIGDRARINPLREDYFGEHRPASTLLEVPALVDPRMKVEIEAEAVVEG